MDTGTQRNTVVSGMDGGADHRPNLRLSQVQRISLRGRRKWYPWHHNLVPAARLQSPVHRPVHRDESKGDSDVRGGVLPPV